MQTLNSSKQDKSGGKADFAAREFPMTLGDFEFIRRLAREHSGIELGDHKKEMIYSRIVRRLRTLQLSSFEQYCQYLESNLEHELTPFINAITTNLTSFFREPHHFEFLLNNALPEIRKRNGNSRRIRIWSAGCSTGEEPYSIAMILNQSLGREQWDARILATDLDTNVLNHARAGNYAAERVAGLKEDVVSKNFIASRQGRNQEERFQVRENIQRFIKFNQLNLLGDWPMKGPFDIIFCRNVVIYFSKDTQRNLFDRYANILSPNGFLFIGHSESLHGVSTRFESIGRTIYRRVR